MSSHPSRIWCVGSLIIETESDSFQSLWSHYIAHKRICVKCSLCFSRAGRVVLFFVTEVGWAPVWMGKETHFALFFFFWLTGEINVEVIAMSPQKKRIILFWPREENCAEMRAPCFIIYRFLATITTQVVCIHCTKSVVSISCANTHLIRFTPRSASSEPVIIRGTRLTRTDGCFYHFRGTALFVFLDRSMQRAEVKRNGGW